MNVKFTIDYDLIDIVDNIGLDFEIINNAIEIIMDEVEYFVDNVEYYDQLTDDEMCDHLLDRRLTSGLIYTQRYSD